MRSHAGCIAFYALAPPTRQDSVNVVKHGDRPSGPPPAITVVQRAAGDATRHRARVPARRNSGVGPDADSRPALLHRHKLARAWPDGDELRLPVAEQDALGELPGHVPRLS